MPTGLGWSGPASSQVIETSRIENIIDYDSTGFYGGGTESGLIYDGAGDFSRSIVTRNGSTVSSLNFDVTSRLDPSSGSFYFLHNAFCVGSCYVDMLTTVEFTLFNSGSEAVDLRFDSQITPGHLARQNFGDGPVEGNFNFTIVDGAFTRPFALQLTGESANNSGTYGTTDPTYLTTYGNAVTLNGLSRQTSGGLEVFQGGAAPNYNLLDWSATNIGIDLRTLYAGETRKVTFVLSTFIRMENPCTQFADCAGLQVAFGDPRNTGSINNIGTLGDQFFDAGLPDDYNPVVGAKYDPFRIQYAFTPQDIADTRATPDVIVHEYDGLYVPPPAAPGVPEPATWAMLVLGFGTLGAAMRRRRGSLALA